MVEKNTKTKCYIVYTIGLTWLGLILILECSFCVACCFVVSVLALYLTGFSISVYVFAVSCVYFVHRFFSFFFVVALCLFESLLYDFASVVLFLYNWSFNYIFLLGRNVKLDMVGK